ncbi:gag protein [Burkholderia pseudomallei]|nr:gag protein [Burkholderia pseudomallei]ARK97601.1 gag protein [Burkholderia pseudomallei]ARL08373.1 gag protein [Burkholderia pseudomallei]ARL87007.1 gag protein [Burkholderia pseudomallei]ARM01010.1 gag protein [Burkholderia pseudomallei]
MAARPSGERIAPAGRCQETTAVRPVRGLRHKGFGLGCHSRPAKKCMSRLDLCTISQIQPNFGAPQSSHEALATIP